MDERAIRFQILVLASLILTIFRKHQKNIVNIICVGQVS